MTEGDRLARLMKALRREGVTDERVLEAMAAVPRERFVPRSLQDLAYDNTALPIALGQTISQPLVVGLMTQALELADDLRVLEVGTGSGYQAAVLARLCAHVYTMERHRPLLEQAEERLRELGYANVSCLVGDGWQGWPEQAPFDRIIVTAAAERVPQKLIAQLKDGGVMVLPVGPDGGPQYVVRLRKKGAALSEEELLPVRFVPLLRGLA